MALKIQALIPAPNRRGPTNNYQQNFAGKTAAKLFNTKIDHSLSQNAKLAFYYSHKISNGWTQPDDLPIPLTATRRGRGNQPTVAPELLPEFHPDPDHESGRGFIRNFNPDPALDGVLQFDALKELGFYGGAPTDFSGVYATGFPRINGLTAGWAARPPWGR